VVELWFGDAAAIAGDEIVNQLSKQPYTSAGRLQLPVTVIAPTGGGVAGGAAHSQTVHNWIGHQPGVVAVTASTPYDAKGLLKSAIRDNNPVFFFPHKKLFDREGEVSDEEYTLPLGETAVKREGADVTVVATQLLFHRALEAAEQLDGELDIEVLNPRTYAPLDTDTIARSVEKTGHLVVADEMPLRYGTQGHIVSQIAEADLDAFDAPPKTIGPDDVPVPYSTPLEDEILPSTDDLIAAIRDIRVE
jgi:pyruvate dehydrogenase E1 component beta subunit